MRTEIECGIFEVCKYAIEATHVRGMGALRMLRMVIKMLDIPIGRMQWILLRNHFFWRISPSFFSHTNFAGEYKAWNPLCKHYILHSLFTHWSIQFFFHFLWWSRNSMRTRLLNLSNYSLSALSSTRLGSTWYYIVLNIWHFASQIKYNVSEKEHPKVNNIFFNLCLILFLAIWKAHYNNNERTKQRTWHTAPQT